MLIFVGDVCGRAEEAVGFYASVFRDAKAEVLARYVDGEEPDKYGVSWQIVPANMGQLIGRNPEKTTSVMLKMKKIVVADLEKAGGVG
jgi:predicted 3-demethylubiquinone-9 3-methyltransferase (glyoxalase superfamily)